jgi:hypothetical protein
MGTSVMNKPVRMDPDDARNRPTYIGSSMTTHTTVNVPMSERDNAVSWSQLSVSVFSRDWDSDEDAVYDDVQQG